jgi:hypothetical protein
MQNQLVNNATTITTTTNNNNNNNNNNDQSSEKLINSFKARLISNENYSPN